MLHLRDVVRGLRVAARALLGLRRRTALGDVPIVLHEADAEWVLRPDDAVELWSADVKELAAA